MPKKSRKNTPKFVALEGGDIVRVDSMDDDGNNKEGLKNKSILTKQRCYSKPSREPLRQPQKEYIAKHQQMMKATQKEARTHHVPFRHGSPQRFRRASPPRFYKGIREKKSMEESTPPLPAESPPPAESPDDDKEEEKLDENQICILEQVKEIYRQAIETDTELLDNKPQTMEEFKAFLAETVAERAKLDPNVHYDVLQEEIVELFKSEDQFSTFIACCEYMMETSTTMRHLIRLILNVINYVKHAPAYKLSCHLQTYTFSREDIDIEHLEQLEFYEEIFNNDPKEQQKNKKRSKKRKLKKIAEEEAAAAAAAAILDDMTEEGDDYNPKLEDLLSNIDFSAFQVLSDLSPTLPKISPEDFDMPGKAQVISDLISDDISHILSVVSEASWDKHLDVLNREILYLEKRTAYNTSFYERRETQIKASIKELSAKNDAENREQQKLEAQIRNLEAEIEKIEERREDAVKKIEKVDDNTFIKYKTQFQNTIKRFHELEEEVKNVSCTIRREKQSFSDLSNAARREDDALKKEIEALEAAVERKQAQLESCETRIEVESQKHDEERQKLSLGILQAEKLILRSTYEREKLTLGRNIAKAQDNISAYRKALEREDDPTRRDILKQHYQQWETYKSQLRSSKQCLDTLYTEKSEQLEKGGNFYGICQFDYPQFYASATPLNDLILPPPAPPAPTPALTQSNYVPSTFHPQQHQVPQQQQQAAHQLVHHQQQQAQLQQQTPQRFRYLPNFSAPPLYVVPVPYNPPTASQSDHAAYVSSANEYNRNQQQLLALQHQQQNAKTTGTETDAINPSHGDTVVQQHHHQQQQYPEVKPHAPHSAPIMGSSRTRYPIGVVPPNYNFVQNDKIWLPPPSDSSDVGHASENNNLNDNSSISFQHAFRQNSNESVKEGGTKIPFQAHELIEGRYPIGVIPPFYVTNNGFEWTPPPRTCKKGTNEQQVFKFPPSNNLFDSDA